MMRLVLYSSIIYHTVVPVPGTDDYMTDLRYTLYNRSRNKSVDWIVAILARRETR